MCFFMDWMNWFYHFFYSDISFTSLLVVYLVNFLKKSPFKRVFVIFFYLHAREQRKTRSSCRWQSTFPPWPRGKGNCLQDCPHRFWVVRGQVKSNWGWRGFNSHSLSWTDRSSIHPKLKSKLDVECRKTLGSTARTGRQTLLPKVFN